MSEDTSEFERDKYEIECMAKKVARGHVKDDWVEMIADLEMAGWINYLEQQKRGQGFWGRKKIRCLINSKATSRLFSR